MADQHSNEGSGNVSGESSDSLVELKIKTLDSRIFSFQVDKNTPVSLFKERIANEIGVPVGQQRLIFRGKVLKDDHLLSEYHVENGITLHLVERQPTQSQPTSDTSSGATNGNSTNQGNDASNAGIPRNRVGQISHSVVLGTFNVGEQGEGIVPDLNRVIGAVLNSFGVGGQPTVNATNTLQSSTSAPQGNETDGARGSGQNQAGNQPQSAQSFPGQSFQFSPQVMQTPLTAAAAIPVPSLNSPIPDALNTLSEVMSNMEARSPNGYQPHTSTANRGDQPRVQLPSDVRGLPTPEALSIVLRHAERLLNSHAIAALSHIAGRLEVERDSSDPVVRGQIQAESVQVGLTMQYLAGVLLELGRTILTLRMGQSPAESSVNAGPAVYLSPAGPNPIMVQPFSLQNSSLFSGPHSTSNPVTVGAPGIGHVPRHINIHIHAGGTALAPVVSAVGNRTGNGEGVQGERNNNAGSGSMRVLPVPNVIATAVPVRPTAAVPSAAQSASTDSLLSSVIADVNSRIRNFVSNMQGENQVASGTGQPDNVAVSEAVDSGVASVAESLQTKEQKSQSQQGEGSNKFVETDVNSKDVSTGTVGCPPSSSEELSVKSEDPSGSALRSTEETAKAVPLGLGLGGLERKRRVKQTKSSVTTGDSGTSSSLDQGLGARTAGQQILQSLASRSSSMGRVENDAYSSNPSVQSGRFSGQGSNNQLDAANAVSQALQSPALDGLLGGVSEQTGVGSPDIFRNMLQQLTQNPQIMNTVSQLAQQVDSQDIGNMFSGSRGQGGGLDLSQMIQQMMPIVSQALGHGASAPPLSTAEPGSQDQRKSAEKPHDNHDFQDDIQEMALRIEQSNSPRDVFNVVAENAVEVYGNGGNAEELLNELCGNESLAKEYVEMLNQDIHQRFQDKSKKDKC